MDDILNEQSWEDTDVTDNWYENYPTDSLPSPFQTEACLTLNDEFLYVSFVCYDDETPDIVSTLRRYFKYWLNDHISIIFSPYNDKLNGYFLNVTPWDAQREGTFINGGFENSIFNTYWDNKWFSEAVRYEDKWIVEMAIPFKIYQYYN